MASLGCRLLWLTCLEWYLTTTHFPRFSHLDGRSSMDQRPRFDQYSNRPSGDHKYSPPPSVSDSRRSSNYTPNGPCFAETPANSIAPTMSYRVDG
jgi:hypothetical protein